VPVLARRLGQSGATVTLTNLGIPGAVVNAEMLTLSASVGGGAPADMVRTSLPLVPASSTVVTVFAGGNDANAIASAVQAGLAGANAATYVDSQVAVFGTGFQALIDGIRSRAPGARLLVVNLPNLAALPYAAAYPSLRQRSLQRAAVGMTTQVINRMATQGIPVVDLMCDPRVYERGNLSADGFHPSDAGYALLAETLFQASLTGVSTPAPTCSQMQVVPGL
jgi:lysophospholipase L1-like esterase